jgi:hypothetical protein
MNVNLLPFTVLWMILAMVVIGLLMYRRWVSREEDDTLHVMESDAAMVPQQAALAQKLESIDRWGKALTAIALVYGLIVGSGYLYQSWLAGPTELFK